MSTLLFRRAKKFPATPLEPKQSSAIVLKKLRAPTYPTPRTAIGQPEIRTQLVAESRLRGRWEGQWVPRDNPAMRTVPVVLGTVQSDAHHCS